MIGLYQLLTRWWTAFALAAALALLGAAHAFETFGGLPPCNLCLKQREVLWAAIAIAAPATLWTVFSGARRGTPRLAAFLLAAVFATGAVTAFFHAGGEAGWWSLPALCSGGGGGVSADALAALATGEGPVAALPSCSDVSWRFLGLSMAAWNVLISAVLTVFSLLACKRPKDARAPRPVKP